MRVSLRSLPFAVTLYGAAAIAQSAPPAVPAAAPTTTAAPPTAAPPTAAPPATAPPTTAPPTTAAPTTAAPTTAARASTAAVTPAAVPATRGGDVSKDPSGVKGLSPLWERIGEGDRAAVAGDFDAAVTAYRDAAAKSPESALAHYRLGQAQTLKGDLKEAERAYQAILQLASPEPAIKAKVLFCLADLRERERLYDEAIARYTDYLAFVENQQGITAFVASVTERRKRLEQWKKLMAGAPAAKARNEKRFGRKTQK